MPIRQLEITNFRMNRIRGIVLVILLAVVLAQIGPFTSASLRVFAEETAVNQPGMINATPTNVRSDPSTVNVPIIQLANGQAVTVLASTIGGVSSYGNEWYKISFTVSDIAYTGYVVDNLVTLNPLPTPTATPSPTPIPYDPYGDFEKYLSDEGFPENYKPGLRTLHGLYPKWEFRVMRTGLEWNDVVNGEYARGRSLIPNTYFDGYKTTDPVINSAGQAPAYDWATNTWNIFDLSNWVMCNPAVISYYLDPRNSLNVTQIFQFEALNYKPEVQVIAGVEKILLGSFMGTEPNEKNKYTPGFNNLGQQMIYAEAFLSAAQYSNVSPYHLAARSLVEVGSGGTSASVTGTFSQKLIEAYERIFVYGYVPTPEDLELNNKYNYYNIAAYSGTDTPLENVRHGLLYAKDGSGNPLNDTPQLIPWSDPLRSIKGGAEWISSKYIDIGQNTLYLQKFDVDNSDGKLYFHQYMTNIKGSWQDSGKIYSAYSSMGILSEAMTFTIPVYNNMPETACALPTKTANPNNWLASLAVDNFSLTLNDGRFFDPSVTGDYSLIVENGVTSVNISATAVVPIIIDGIVQNISGIGSVQLAIGNNPVSVVVTAANGDQRTYTMSIVRKAPPEIPPLTSSIYVINGGTLSGLNPLAGQNDVSVLTSNLSATAGYTISVVMPNGSPCTGLVGTGSTIRVLAGNQSVQDYKVVLFGDANGDGELNAIDLTTINRSILQITAINGEYLSASDVNHDGEVNAIDLTFLVRHILSIKDVLQN